jgi:hypothetical protein
MKKDTLDSKPKTFLLHIIGGLGKVIMATAVVRSYKLAHPEDQIVVVSGYPEVFVNNPDVHRNFNFNTPYLWQDYYSKPEIKIYAQDPYFTPQWVKNKPVHLIDIWCGELGIPSVQKTPLLYFSGPEVDELQSMIKVDKPLVVVQSTGGPNPAARAWTRNPPADEFNAFLEKFKDTHFILHLCLKETPVLEAVHQRIENLNRRQAIALVYYANEVIGIDSYAMHARAANTACGKSTFFFPLSESVEKLGYTKENWNNIVPVPEVQNLISASQDYFASVFQHSIDSVSENCPVPTGVKWFDL